jgi:hypothetical protein
MAHAILSKGGADRVSAITSCAVFLKNYRLVANALLHYVMPNNTVTYPGTDGTEDSVVNFDAGTYPERQMMWEGSWFHTADRGEYKNETYLLAIRLHILNT